MEFALLASGSKGNCFLLKDEGTQIMIDCGGTGKYLSGRFRELGVRKDDLDAVLITHDHTDHVAQIRRFSDLPVYSPVEIEDVEAFTVRPMQAFCVGGLKVTPLALSHDAANTTGYVVENGQEKLVYVTDTGYLNRNYFSLCRGADYIVMESNHDVEMLMHTRRPRYLKARICSDQGHLCNEDCAAVLEEIITENTKMILLAHISQEANTRERALETVCEDILSARIPLHPGLIVSAAGQFEMIRKGLKNEKTDPGTVCRSLGMEYMADVRTEPEE